MVQPKIISLVKDIYNETVSKCSIAAIRDEAINIIINEVGESPIGTAVDRLIAQFAVMNDSSIIYVKHDIAFGFVT